MLRTFAAFALLLLAAPAQAEVPPMLGLDGWIGDSLGDGLVGDHDVVFSIYDLEVGGTALFTSPRVITFDDGQFSTYLGEVEVLELELFETSPDLYVGIAVNGDDEMEPRTRLSSSPFAAAAGFAEFAADAEFLEGNSASDFRRVDSPIDHGDLINVPSEADPLFYASEAASITSTDTGLWTEAYGWGNHGDAGYLTAYSETDPLFSSSSAATISSDDVDYWSAAFAWGDHADAGYLLTEADGSDTNELITDVSLVGNTLHITDAGGTSYVDLGSVDPTFADPENGGATVALSGSDADHPDTGVALRTLVNPEAGEAIFRVLSSGGAERLRVEHDGAVATVNTLHVNNTGTSSFLGPITVQGGLIDGDQVSEWNDAHSWGDHGDAGYLTSVSETDPAFAASEASGITSSDTGNWTTAHGWGDHGQAGYLTSYTETDPLFSASEAASITSSEMGDWDQAHGWGDHGSAGYYSASGGAVSGNVTVDGRLRAQSGNSNIAGIDFDPNPGGGSGDTAQIRYFAVSGDATKLRIAVGNDTNDTIELQVSGQDALVVGKDEVGIDGAFEQIGCPTGFSLENGVCYEFQNAWGSQTWGDAQETCHALHARICTYRDALLGWGSATEHLFLVNADWLGDFAGDDTVLDVNDWDNKSNFEGEASKNGSHEFACCITPN